MVPVYYVWVAAVISSCHFFYCKFKIYSKKICRDQGYNSEDSENVGIRVITVKTWTGVTSSFDLPLAHGRDVHKSFFGSPSQV